MKYGCFSVDSGCWIADVLLCDFSVPCACRVSVIVVSVAVCRMFVGSVVLCSPHVPREAVRTRSLCTHS